MGLKPGMNYEDFYPSAKADGNEKFLILRIILVVRLNQTLPIGNRNWRWLKPMDKEIAFKNREPISYTELIFFNREERKGCAKFAGIFFFLGVGYKITNGTII
jgi:hypothetical protein